MQMPTFITENWQYLTALIGGAVATYRFLVSRNDELAWKRTEFLFSQAQYLESNPEMREILQILGDNHNDYGICDVIDDDTSISDSEKYRLRNNLDHFLNFFDRLYYAHVTAKTMTKAEVMVFEWYLAKIQDTKELAEYCRVKGFHDVLKLATLVRAAP